MLRKDSQSQRSGDEQWGASEQNLRDSKESTSARAKSAHQVAGNGESTNAGAAESRSSRNDPFEFLVHGFLTVTSHNQTLLFELLGDIARGRARDLDPGLREDSAGDEHVDDEDGGLERVREGLGDA